MRALLAFFRRLFGHSTPVAWTPTPCVTRYGTVIHRGGQEEIDGLQRLGLPFTRHTFYTAQDVGGATPTPNYRAVFEARLVALDAIGVECLILVWDFQSADHAVATMMDLTQRYPNRLWQVGNEYDAQSVTFPWCDTGDKYAALMQRIVAACAVGTRFVGMGLATSDPLHPPAVPDRERRRAYLQSYEGVFQAPSLLAWCLHVYGLPMRDVATEQIQDFQAVYHGPLWVTEFGCDRTIIEAKYGPQRDADVDRYQMQCAQDFIAVASALGVIRAYWYDFWNQDDYGFGLVRDNDDPRPSWYTLKTAA